MEVLIFTAVKVKGEFSKATNPSPLSVGDHKKVRPEKGLDEIFKVMKSKDLQPRLLYPARLLFKMKGEIASLPTNKKQQRNIVKRIKWQYTHTYQ